MLRGCAVKASASRLVVEGSALSTLFWTGVFKRLDQLPVDALVTVGTLDIFRHLLMDKHSRMWSKRAIGIGKRGVFLDERSDEVIEASRANLDEFIAWVEDRCEVQTAIAVADYPRKERNEVEKLFGSEAVESIALATKEKIPLWTDDFGISEAAKEDVPGRVWTELILEKLGEDSMLPTDVVKEFKVSLIDAGYHYTRVDGDMINIALEASHWDASVRPLSSLVRWFHISGVNMLGAIQLAAYTLRKTCEEAPLAHHKSEITRAIIRSLAERPDAVEVLNGMQLALAPIYGLYQLGKKEANAIIQQELVRKARERPIILPGDPDWPT